jgi:molybdate transport system ATP-binding protein
MALQLLIEKKLKDFDLKISFDKGEERLGILGASGDGKSMTLKCIAGIETPDTGKIVLNNRVLFDSEQKINVPPQKRKVGYLFQNYALFPNMTVEQNIGISLTGTKEEKKRIVAEQIKKFHLDGLEKNYPTAISGGQQQRVSLARIMAYQPELIMLDEPFSALDSYLKDILQEQLLESLMQYNGDVIIVSHSRDEIYRFCEKLIIFSKGKSIIMGETKDLFESPKTVGSARLTGCKNISPIKKIDEYTMLCTDWDIVLCTKEKIGDDIRYVGIRAHSFIASNNSDEQNTFKIQVHTKAEMPFEIHFKCKTNNSKTDQFLWWYISKNKLKNEHNDQVPEYLSIQPEALMLLK